MISGLGTMRALMAQYLRRTNLRKKKRRKMANNTDPTTPEGFSGVLGLNPIGEYITKRFAEMQGNRVNWESHWEEIARYIVPNKDDIWGNQTKGERKTDHLFDSTAKRYSNELASALHSMLTNPTTQWFELSTGNREIDGDREVKIWMQETVEIMLQVLNNSNFQEQILEVYHELATFGTAPLRIEEDPEDFIRFYSRPIYKCFISQNNRMVIDTLIRKYKFTVRQLLQEFGPEALTREMHQQLKEKPNTEYEILHAVGPRSDLLIAGLDAEGPLPFYSLHILASNKKLLNPVEAGFNEFPYACPRWMKIAGETYGRSPGMDVLPDIKTINAMKKVILQGAQIVVAPPLQAVDNSLIRPVKFRPFGMNYRRPGSEPIQPIVTGANPQIGMEVMEAIRQDINECFFIHQLRMVQADRMTATEVVQRRDEQLRGLGGILGRLQNELLAPIINRAFGIMLRQNLFSEMPEILASINKMEIEYTSMLARAQVQGDAESVQRALSQVLPIMESQPEIMDNIDGDAMLRISFDKFGVDERFLKAEEDVESVREERAAAMQEQEQSAMMQQQGQAAGSVAPLLKAVKE